MDKPKVEVKRGWWANGNKGIVGGDNSKAVTPTIASQAINNDIQEDKVECFVPVHADYLA